MIRRSVLLLLLLFFLPGLLVGGTCAKPTGSILLQVRNIGGMPLSGARIISPAYGLERRTGQAGYYFAADIPAGTYTVRIEHPGYEPRFVRMAVEAGATPLHEIYLAPTTTVRLRAPATEANEILSDHVEIQIPPAAFGASEKNVEIRYATTGTSPDSIRAMPGSFSGVSAKGAEPIDLESFGAVSITALSNGKELQLAPGKKLLVRLPCPAPCVVPKSSGRTGAPDQVPLWSLDENTGLWMREGAGRIVREEGKPPYVEAELPHLSSWNCDFPIEQKTTILVQGVRDSIGIPLNGMTLSAEGLDYAGYTLFFDKAEWNFGVNENSHGTCIEVRPRSRIRLKVRAWNAGHLYEAERIIETGDPGLDCSQSSKTAGVIVRDLELSKSPVADSVEIFALDSIRKLYNRLESIHLRNGRVVRGAIIGHNQQILTVRTAGGVSYFPESTIKYVTYDAWTSPDNP